MERISLHVKDYHPQTLSDFTEQVVKLFIIGSVHEVIFPTGKLAKIVCGSFGDAASHAVALPDLTCGDLFLSGGVWSE